MKHLILGVLLIGTLACSPRPQSTDNAEAVSQASPGIPSATAAVTAATPSPTTAPTPTPREYVIANTGGDGVFIRRTPDQEDRIKAWPDGTRMVVIGDDLERDGILWRTVRDPDGNEGWIPAEYLTAALAESAAEPTKAPEGDTAPPGYDLVLLASNGTRDRYGFATVEGQVKNVSNESLRNVQVVVEWFTAEGEFVKSDQALVEYDPILPGQTSPFTSITSDNPAMAKFRVTFKHLLGGTIPTWDGRK